jgi:beta-glucosidase
MLTARRLLTVTITATALALAAPAGADTLPYQDPTLPVAQRVSDLVSRMTLAEKIGQMTQTERYQVYDDPSAITTYGLGSILSGGGSTPTENTPAAWADMVDRFQSGRSARRPPSARSSSCPAAR